jgi:hypothetical protein
VADPIGASVLRGGWAGGGLFHNDDSGHGVWLHDSGSESDVHSPTAVARSLVCCSIAADRVDGVWLHSGGSVGGHRVPW